MSALPLVLAGPILRRVDADSVSVWVALSKPLSVRLLIKDNDYEIESDWQEPVSVFDQLHVAVISCPYPPQYDWTYDLELTDAVGRLSKLASEKWFEEGKYRIPAMPETFKELQLSHCSCRKPHGAGRDALPLLWPVMNNSKEQRPHALFLTGNQIYADDVAAPMLQAIMQLSCELCGNSQAEMIPLQLDSSGNETLRPLGDFPAGSRGDLVLKQAHFTTRPAENHLIGLSEFCAAYLLCWNPDLWEGRFENTDLGKGLNEFKQDIKSTRKILAKIPVYMIFDEHEITGHWYRYGAWKENVLTSSLGKIIIRNGLLAYSLFQAWGNNPSLFSKTSSPAPANAQLIALIPKLHSTDKSTNKIKINSPIANEIDQLLGLSHSPRETAHWHYQLNLAGIEVRVLDIFTQREYPSPLSPSILITKKYGILEEQLDLPKDTTIPMMIISPKPILGAGDIKPLEETNYLKNLDNSKSDSWSDHAETFKELVKKLSDRRNVIVLSGNVHYAAAIILSRMRQYFSEPVSQIVELISSPSKGYLDSPTESAYPLSHNSENIFNTKTKFFFAKSLPIQPTSTLLNLLYFLDINILRDSKRTPFLMFDNNISFIDIKFDLHKDLLHITQKMYSHATDSIDLSGESDHPYWKISAPSDAILLPEDFPFDSEKFYDGLMEFSGIFERSEQTAPGFDFPEGFWYKQGAFFFLVRDKSPSEGLNHMVGNPDKYTFDCLRFVYFSRLYGICKAMGSNNFDKCMPSSAMSTEVAPSITPFFKKLPENWTAADALTPSLFFPGAGYCLTINPTFQLTDNEGPFTVATILMDWEREHLVNLPVEYCSSFPIDPNKTLEDDCFAAWGLTSGGWESIQDQYVKEILKLLEEQGRTIIEYPNYENQPNNLMKALKGNLIVSIIDLVKGIHNIDTVLKTLNLQ